MLSKARREATCPDGAAPTVRPAPGREPGRSQGCAAPPGPGRRGAGGAYPHTPPPPSTLPRWRDTSRLRRQSTPEDREWLRPLVQALPAAPRRSTPSRCTLSLPEGCSSHMCAPSVGTKTLVCVLPTLDKSFSVFLPKRGAQKTRSLTPSSLLRCLPREIAGITESSSEDPRHP